MEISKIANESPNSPPLLEPPDPDTALLDPQLLELGHPDTSKIIEDSLHQVLAANAFTRRKSRRPIARDKDAAEEVVSLPYAEQVTSSTTTAETKADTAKKVSDVLKNIKVQTTIDSLTQLSPPLQEALEKFFAQFSSASVLRASLLDPASSSGIDCTYVNITVNKVKVRAILDTGAPGNIISTRLAKKLKLAPDINCKLEFGTAGPWTTVAKGAYSSLLLRFGKLCVTAPAIVLENANYDILIGTSKNVEVCTFL